MVSLFYYDKVLLAYEASFQWDQALEHLEKLFLKKKEIHVLYSLIGFSWFYLIEGPVVSKKYANDPNTKALDAWKKYIDAGILEVCDDSYFCFIAGYTLSLHGFYINEEYEKKGNRLIQACLNSTSDALLRQLAENFMMNERSIHYIHVKDGKSICERFFNGKSLLDGYFNRIYDS